MLDLKCSEVRVTYMELKSNPCISLSAQEAPLLKKLPFLMQFLERGNWQLSLSPFLRMRGDHFRCSLKH